jgi:hypothetical protein
VSPARNWEDDTYKEGDVSVGLRDQYLEHSIAEKITGVSNSDTTIRHSKAFEKIA